MDETTTDSSDLDLDIVKTTARQLKAPSGRSSNTRLNVKKQQPQVNHAGLKRRVRDRGASDIETSDDDLINSKALSQEPKSLKRKRSGRKPKHSKSEKRNKRRLRDAVGLDVDDDLEYSSNDEKGVEVSDYLLKRRSQLDRKTEVLKEAGLKLPPTYNDVDFSDDERLANLKEKPVFVNEVPSGKYEDKELPYSRGLVPASIMHWLHEYQVDGAAFLHKHFVYQTGCILGDDMGLGKTIQVIAFLTAAFGKTGDARDYKRMRKMRRARASWYPRVLVVCPGSLMENWKAEFERWGWWHVDSYHGATKQDALQAIKAGHLEILITTYDTYRGDKDSINTVEWDCVIADECHNLKSVNSGRTQAMNEVNALCRVGLSGTVIQNSYEELWTLLNWTNPGKFGPLSQWKTTISEPMKAGQSHEATEYQLSRTRKTATALTQNLLPPFFLRRTKKLIANQMPKKTDRVVFCPLTEAQVAAYKTFLNSEILEYIKSSSDDCTCGSEKKAGWCCKKTLPNGEKWQKYILPSIQILQKLANHIAILIPNGDDSKEKQEKDLETLKMAVPDDWKSLYRSRGAIENFANTDFCGKWLVLRKLLKFWHGNGDKVLVFSYSVRLLNMLRLLLQFTKYNVSFLDGSLSYKERATAVDDFNADPQQFVFLISTKAGGCGFNITSANKVVVMDPNWNPAYDLQAQDRAYRIGQTREVEVFRLVSTGTIEEIVYARQIYKQQQANIGYTASTERRYFKGVQNSATQKGEIFGLQNLFSFSEKLTLRDIINKTNIAESRAGVSMLDYDAEFQGNNDPLAQWNDNNENGAMSQLAALVGKGEKSLENVARKSDPAQAILASLGVEYTHENSEVIGSSHVEAHLSRKAEEGGWDMDIGHRRVFASQSQSQSQSQRLRRSRQSLDDQDDSPDYDSLEEDENEDADMDMPDYIYAPSMEVMKRQFCTMAKTFGYEDPTTFALVVEGWTQEQRRYCLDRFYAMRRKELGWGKGE